jgi:hypothetical protein
MTEPLCEFVKIPGCTCGASEHYKAGAGHHKRCPLYADAPPHPTWIEPWLLGEIERLTEELDTHLKVHLGVVRENVRLRAALKKLVDWTTEKTPGWAPLEEARAALAAAETKA